MAEGASLGLEAYFDEEHGADDGQGDDRAACEPADSWRWAEGGVMAVFVCRQKEGIDV